jgi:hypothetical protein
VLLERLDDARDRRFLLADRDVDAHHASLVPQYCFWLMIVSSATAVLPVLRSPMISSRCPRPIGIMASTP